MAHGIENLVAGEVRDIENVDGLLAKCGDVGRSDVQAQVEKRLGQIVKQPDAVNPG